MSIKIKSKNSVVKDKAPLPADLEIGELALNAHQDSPAIYLKDAAGAVRKIAGAGAVGGTDATTAAKGIVQLADAAAITAGTAGRVVDAAQLKASTPDATAAVKGIVQLADAAAVTAGTAGRVVDAAQLKSAVDTNDEWTRTGTTIAPKTAGDVVTISAGTVALPGLTPVGDPNTGICFPGADQAALSTGGITRVAISSNGSIGIGIGSSSVPAGYGVVAAQAITGQPSSFGVVCQGVISSDVTSTGGYYVSIAETAASSFTLVRLNHFATLQNTFGAGSTVTTQVGYFASPTMVGATNNYGFYSAIPFGTGRWNFYASGTADSYFASNNFIFANGGAEKARVDSSGKLLVGMSTAATGSAAKLQCTTTAHLGAVAVYADNTAAKAGGLVAGDIYRKADGTLMITF